MLVLLMVVLNAKLYATKGVIKKKSHDLLMILPFATSASKDPASVLAITLESTVFGILGIILGTIIDKLFKKLSDEKKELKLLISILQIAFSGAVLGLIFVYLSPFFTDHFQRSLSGLAFPALFYGVQSNIYSQWQELLN